MSSITWFLPLLNAICASGHGASCLGNCDEEIATSLLQRGLPVHRPSDFETSIKQKLLRSSTILFVDRRPHIGSFVGCFPFKNGMTWWTRFACVVDDQCTSAYNGLLGGLSTSSATDLEEVYFGDVIPRWMVTRNPMIRLLSGYLTFAGVDSVYNNVPNTFEEFVTYLERGEQWGPLESNGPLNPHWMMQRSYCLMDEGFTYTLYKAEDRDQWEHDLLNELDPHYWEEALALNVSTVADEANEPGPPCVGYHCHAKDVMSYYYTPDLYDRVSLYYADDIKRLNYSTDVEQLKQEVFYPISALQLNHQTRSPQQDAFILDAFERRVYGRA